MSHGYTRATIRCPRVDDSHRLLHFKSSLVHLPLVENQTLLLDELSYYSKPSLRPNCNKGDEDDLEEQLHVAIVALNNGANAVSIREHSARKFNYRVALFSRSLWRDSIYGA